MYIKILMFHLDVRLGVQMGFQLQWQYLYIWKRRKSAKKFN